ncbi:acetate--CoA ligase [Bacillus fonticola]|uniref:acetate--CoA ligase n=1 Tax=Bacillus fonticola TaxID=2728853 RepID=UPI00147474FC|nr:acetate--CoA ligase [Bacillus fonticola]
MTTSIPPLAGQFQLQDYENTRETFRWEDVHTQFNWYSTGNVNMAHECVDRHVENGKGDRIALRFLADDGRETTTTYAQLKEETDHLATVLAHRGVQEGDFVFVFLPKEPSVYVAMLAAIKLGAVVAPLFEAFMEDGVRDRMNDCEGKYLITNEAFYKRVPRGELPALSHVFLTDGKKTNEAEGIFSLPSELAAGERDPHILRWVSLDSGLNIHYTSGSTGKPKGIVHAHRVMIQQYQTGKWVLDLREDDVYWCTAHPGWVTGTVYGVFAPLLHGVEIVIVSGRFTAEGWYQALEKTGVTVWYSAPTAFRMLMAQGAELTNQFDLSSLRHIMSVGEPLNPEVIYWGQKAFNLRIHDTWWMTETGAQLVANLPSQPIKPGSMGRAIPGITVAVLDDEGNELPRGEIGHLAVQAPWPALMKEVWRNEEKFQSYFPFEGWYVSGDLARQDDDGYVFFQGRSDDMINSSGERIGPFEVESTLISHPAVAEAGVIGKPDPVRGEIVKAFLVLRNGYEESESLKEELYRYVKTHLAGHAAPREIQIVSSLPKTKISGKILRRELKRLELEKLSLQR